MLPKRYWEDNNLGLFVHGQEEHRASISTCTTTVVPGRLIFPSLLCDTSATVKLDIELPPTLSRKRKSLRVFPPTWADNRKNLSPMLPAVFLKLTMSWEMPLSFHAAKPSYVSSPAISLLLSNHTTGGNAPRGGGECFGRVMMDVFAAKEKTHCLFFFWQMHVSSTRGLYTYKRDASEQ